MLFPFIVSLIGLFFLLFNGVRFHSTRKNKDTLYRIITIYLILLFIVEFFCNLIGFYKPGQNFYLSHYYFVFQFVTMSLFFYHLFSIRFLKRIVAFLLVAVLLFLGIQYFTNPSIYWQFNMLEIGITSVLLISYAILFLVLNIKNDKSKYFYFCNGLIVYLTSSAGIFLSGNSDSVIFMKPFMLDFWFFNSLFYILYQFLIYKEWKVLNHDKNRSNDKKIKNTNYLLGS